MLQPSWEERVPLIDYKGGLATKIGSISRSCAGQLNADLELRPFGAFSELIQIETSLCTVAFAKGEVDYFNFVEGTDPLLFVNPFFKPPASSKCSTSTIDRNIVGINRQETRNNGNHARKACSPAISVPPEPCRF